MGELTASALEIVHQLVGRAASEQGGVFSGDNPSHYNSANPLRLWVIQVIIIMAMTQALALIFGRMRQPRVIAEIIGGVFLGPTVMGRIKGFKQAIFPDESLPMLNLTSTIGLVLFLFLVGLEIDTRLIKRNARTAAIVSLAGLIVPLGLGAALGVGLYREFIPDTVNFGYFLLFVAVAIGITAFPVLCRILTELKLLDTTVGVVVLAAGVGNDVVGWVLLALTVALVNATSGLTALWVFLTSVGYVIFLLFPVKMGYRWLAIRTGSLEKGTPTPFLMTLTILLVFFSAFFTDIIGVHAIFGGFLAGLVIPHDNGFAISIVEKLEDLVVILLLPLYFALSGLRTNLGLLNNGITWGYTVLICVVAFAAKFLSCGIAAKIQGFNFRESGAIGSLMACKGLVELIVLNVGLQAGVLDTRTFSMFVIHAIILTFITTPLVLLFYPSRVRVHEGTGNIRDNKKATLEEGKAGGRASETDQKSRFALVLDRVEQLPAAMTLTTLLNPTPTVSTSTTSLTSTALEKKAAPIPAITIDALRLIELSNRTSAVFKSQEAELLVHSDPVVAVMRTFGHLNKLSVSASLSVVPYDDFPSAITNHVSQSDSQMLVLPWSRGHAWQGESTSAQNPFDGIFHRPSGLEQANNSVVYSEFIRNVFQNAPVDMALFVDGSVQSQPDLDRHLFLPFFGGPDDRLALNFLVQLCANPHVHATVVRISKSENDLTPISTIESVVKKPEVAPTHGTITAADTVYGAQTTETRLASDTADNILWDRLSTSSTGLRIHFSKHETSRPLRYVIETAKEMAATTSPDLIVMIGRSRRLAVLSHTAELDGLVAEKGVSMSSLVPRTLGDVGAGLVASGSGASLLVMQASGSRD